MSVHGSCLCRAVQFEITGKTTDIGMCHCSLCRKVSGVASNATLIAGRDRFRWLAGEANIVKFELPSGWGPWRCSICGSPLPKLRPDGGAYWVPVGLLDEDPRVRIAGHIFVGSRAPWDEIAGTAPQFSEGLEGARAK
jgi:hypothetical protein